MARSKSQTDSLLPLDVLLLNVGIQPDKTDPAIFYNCSSTSSPLYVVEVDPEAGWASIAFVSIAGKIPFTTS